MRVRLPLLCLVALTVSMAHAEDPYGQFYSAIRSNNLSTLRQLLESGASPNVAGSQKMTPLHDAAFIGSGAALKLLLEHGADVNARNSAGRTPLLYATGDREKTRLLLQHGANIKIGAPGPPPFGGEFTVLMMAAARKGGADVVRELLAKGADAAAQDGQGATALNRAAGAGDLETMALLLAHGADVNAAPRANAALTPLMAATMSRQPAAVKLLLAKGAKVNTALPIDQPARVKNGPIDLGGQTALHFAAQYGPVEIVKLLLDAGADVNAKDIQGMTPLMWSVASDYQNPDITRLLLARGADATIKSRDGETAISLARRLGAAGGIQALGGLVDKPQSVPVSPEAPDARTALLRGLAILDRHSSSSFLQSGGCVACHAQMAAQFAASNATGKVALSDENAKRLQTLKPGLEIAALQGASGEGFLYGLEALRAVDDLPLRSTDYAVASLASMQNEDGSWHGNVARTPIQDGDFTQTALSVRALAKYAPRSMQAEITARLAKARKWLLNAKPISTESAVMRMLGLSAAGADASEVQRAARAVLDQQRPDGGWPQRHELSSDAYSTGMALWALADAEQVMPSDPVYQRGVQFLTGTQAADGSWHVKSRAVLRFQPYFESGFPYEHDQWISSMATGWAAKALAAAVE